MQTDTEFRPVDGQTAPEHFEPLTGFELIPDDIDETPPATVTLYMSPDFTNDGGADVDFGKTRHYVVEIEYPDPLDNTVVRMDDCSTALGSRIFRKFVDGMAVEKGYTKDRLDLEDMLN